MKTKATISLFLYALFLPLSACANEPQTELRLIVVDDDGTPVENADIAIGFIPRSGNGPLVRAMTNTDGMVRKKGFSIQPIRYWVTKKGFYPSSSEAPNHIQNTTSYPGGPIGWTFDESIDSKVILREIRDPVPMYASRIRMGFSESKGTFAFDLMARDWLPPYGNGRTTDILVHVDFVFRELDDHDLQITWEFVGEVNGIQPFSR